LKRYEEYEVASSREHIKLFSDYSELYTCPWSAFSYNEWDEC